MTRYVELSPYDYVDDSKNNKVFNIGWLENGYQFNTKRAVESVLEILWEFCLISITQTRGLHECDLCKNPTTIVEKRNGVSLALGSAEIRVFGENGTVYAAPNLIYHYVKEHNYAPPEEFIRALFDGPKPVSSEYFDKLNNLGVSWSKTLSGDSSGERFSF